MACIVNLVKNDHKMTDFMMDPTRVLLFLFRSLHHQFEYQFASRKQAIGSGKYGYFTLIVQNETKDKKQKSNWNFRKVYVNILADILIFLTHLSMMITN